MPGPPKPPATSSCATTTGSQDRERWCETGAARFIDTFDEIFRTEVLKILKTPVRTPVANTFAERWIRTLRRELLDRTIIWNQRQVERLVVDYIDHYNAHRTHHSLDQRPPLADPSHLCVVKSTRCSDLINEYQHAA